MGKPKEKRPLGRCRCMWDYNIEMVHKEIVWGSIDCSVLAQDRDR
jgi:hypothetical protein